MIIAKRPLSISTDHLYFKRELRYHLEDGRVISSIDLNWHSVELNKVAMLELIIRGIPYRIVRNDLPNSFVEFIHFRSKGFNFIIDDGGLRIPEEYNSWSIGWTDGFNEYLLEVDFATGKPKRSYNQKLDKLQVSHFHPQSLILSRGIKN